MRSRPQPRNGKRVGNEVWFDAKLPAPLGLALDTTLGTAMGDAFRCISKHFNGLLS